MFGEKDKFRNWYKGITKTPIYVKENHAETTLQYGENDLAKESPQKINCIFKEKCPTGLDPPHTLPLIKVKEGVRTKKFIPIETILDRYLFTKGNKY